ncbi:OmpA family protein [Sulfuritalea sp.]|uniref:OmpA family protein n=1 Tax=Sulfuritalea sp. TaxID=2480090 RepID=UPI00286DAD2D|nr:OmpA family protein [Sulfuritalea sp.]
MLIRKLAASGGIPCASYTSYRRFANFGWEVIVKTTKNLVLTALLAGLLASAQSMAAEPERKTVSINDRVPTPQQVADALFPKEIEALKKECAQAEKAGMRCQSRIPKSSLDSVLVTFPRGSASLSGEAQEFLSAVGQALKSRELMWTSMRIEGHTDVTGSPAVNQRLSKERADVVKSYLVKNFGLKNIETVGRSSEQLKDPADPESALNRRIEFVPEW